MLQAIFVANFGNNWGFHLLLTELPIYMKTILRRDINSNALLSSLPYACMWAFSLLISFLADLAISKKILRTGIVRRIANTIGKGSFNNYIDSNLFASFLTTYPPLINKHRYLIEQPPLSTYVDILKITTPSHTYQYLPT